MLSESNQASFDSLQEMEEVGSQAVLNNTETFGLYAARVLDQQMGTRQTVNITGDNMSQSTLYYTIQLCGLYINSTKFYPTSSEGSKCSGR